MHLMFIASPCGSCFKGTDQRHDVFYRLKYTGITQAAFYGTFPIQMKA
jgi:hypothetical protein